MKLYTLITANDYQFFISLFWGQKCKKEHFSKLGLRIDYFACWTIKAITKSALRYLPFVPKRKARKLKLIDCKL